MQLSNGSDQAETQAVALAASAALDPVKPLQDVLALLEGNARPTIRDPSQVWRTFLKNHAQDLIALDFFTVPTATFRVLFVLVVLSHGRRRLRHFDITEHPTAEWTGDN